MTFYPYLFFSLPHIMMGWIILSVKIALSINIIPNIRTRKISIKTIIFPDRNNNKKKNWLQTTYTHFSTTSRVNEYSAMYVCVCMLNPISSLLSICFSNFLSIKPACKKKFFTHILRVTAWWNNGGG